MEQINNKSFKELNEMVEVVAKRFFVARTLHQNRMEHSLAENDFDENSPYDIYLSRVLEAYEVLSEQEQNLINNEFFYQNYRDWWKTIYTHATFYRRKKEAMIKFLGALYHG